MPKLRFIHANCKATGCSAEFELHPAKDGDEGYVRMSLANQMSYGNMPKFDYDDAVNVNLSFIDLCKMLQVFRGECEDIDYGKGIVNVGSTVTTVTTLSHVIEPVCGYRILVKSAGADSLTKVHSIMLSSCEALGLCEAICGCLSIISFGLPICANT